MGDGHCNAGCLLPRRGLDDRNHPVCLGHPSYCRDGCHNRSLFALYGPCAPYFLDRTRIRWKLFQLMVLRKLGTAQEVPPERSRLAAQMSEKGGRAEMSVSSVWKPLAECLVVLGFLEWFLLSVSFSTYSLWCLSASFLAPGLGKHTLITARIRALTVLSKRQPEFERPFSVCFIHSYIGVYNPS